MISYREIFTKKNTVLIVIHVVSMEQAFRNAEIARESGADGIFLINHFNNSALGSEELTEIYKEIHNCHSGWWVGINYLDLTTEETISRVPASASGIWIDNMGIDESKEDPVEEARLNWQLLKEKEWEGLCFGGVAFKYQKRVVDLARVSKFAMEYTDVITTSGEATGKAADLKKIKDIRKAIGDFPLAVASGITPENIHEYLGNIDCFLVNTGVSKSFTELDQKKVEKLIKAVI